MKKNVLMGCGRWIGVFRVILVLAVFSFGWNLEGFAAEIFVPSLEGVPGEDLEIPLMIRDGENLAALKAIILYDPDILLYKAVRKTQFSNSFIHVANDVYPGKLILVMAAAEGISSKNYPIVKLLFEVNGKVSKDTVASLEISGVELVNEKLKSMDFTLHLSPIHIKIK